MNELAQYVEIKPDLAGGVPVFKGTRVAIKTMFDYLEEESLCGFPTVLRDQAECVIDSLQKNFYLA